MIDYIRENRALAIYAHPFWSYTDLTLLASLRGLTGMEIVNYSCEQEWKSGIAEIYFEYLWRKEYKNPDGPVFCFGSDDAHGHVPDYCGGYITVKAETLTHGAILDTITAGSFYASYGPAGVTAPKLYGFYVADGVAYVECSPCRNSLSGQGHGITDFCGYRSFFTINGFRKPIYNAFSLYSKLGNKLLEHDFVKDEYTGIIPTKDDKKYLYTVIVMCLIKLFLMTGCPLT